jgi:hypothetical protein
MLIFLSLPTGKLSLPKTVSILDDVSEIFYEAYKENVMYIYLIIFLNSGPIVNQLLHPISTTRAHYKIDKRYNLYIQ